jgi:hypothetical protein
MIYCFLKNDKCFHTNTSHLLKASRGRERLDLVSRQKTNGLCYDDFKTSVLFLRGFDSVSGEKKKAKKPDLQNYVGQTKETLKRPVCLGYVMLCYFMLC